MYGRSAELLEVYLRAETLLGGSAERHAEDFAWGLLVDEHEPEAAWALESWEIANHFGIPEEVRRGRIQLGLWTSK